MLLIGRRGTELPAAATSTHLPTLVLTMSFQALCSAKVLPAVVATLVEMTHDRDVLTSLDEAEPTVRASTTMATSSNRLAELTKPVISPFLLRYNVMRSLVWCHA